jgi:hypothetical protein
MRRLPPPRFFPIFIFLSRRGSLFHGTFKLIPRLHPSPGSRLPKTPRPASNAHGSPSASNPPALHPLKTLLGTLARPFSIPFHRQNIARPLLPRLLRRLLPATRRVRRQPPPAPPSRLSPPAGTPPPSSSPPQASPSSNSCGFKHHGTRRNADSSGFPCGDPRKL